MTLDTDFVRLHLWAGTSRVPCKSLGMEWPPPERLYIYGGIREAQDGDDETFVMIRTRCSELDDKVADHPYIARGAEYHYARVAEIKQLNAAIQQVRALADVSDWHVYESRDTGDVYPAALVQDRMADIRAALDGQVTEP